MSELRLLHLLYFCNMFIYLDIFTKTFSEAKNVSTSMKKAPVVIMRHKRAEDEWNSSDIFLCEDDENSLGLIFSLTCRNNYACKMTTFSPNKEEISKVLNLDLLTDNCRQPFNPFYETSAGRAASHPNLPFVVTQMEIVELELRYTNFTNLPPQYLCKLTNTTKLRLIENRLKSSADLGLTGQCGVSQCCGCQLQDLILLRNNLQILNNFSFCGLPNLRSLNLDSNAIAQIDASAFATLGNLQELIVNNNLLRELSPYVFEPVGNLKHLSLERNMLNELSLRSLHDLHSLEELKLSSNRISQLEFENFKGLKNLKKLYLKHNNLLYLGDTLHSLENIIILDLSENSLSNITELEFDSMANLSILDLSRNNFTSMPSLAFCEDADLKSLDLSNNKLTTVPEFLSLKKVQYINLSNNKIGRFSVRDKNTLCSISVVKSLNLNSNLINGLISNAFDCNGIGNAMETLSLKRNRIKDITGIFNTTKIKHLLLMQNNINVLSLADISTQVVTLDVSKNNISKFSGIHPNDAYSNNNVSMKKLILEANFISNLSNAYFPNSLEYLHLGANRLTNLSISTTKENTSASMILPPNIKEVDLTFNRLPYVCSLISAIIKSENIPIFRFTGNPIRCSCEHEFIAKHDTRIRRQPIKCSPQGFSKNDFKESNISQNSFSEISQLHYPDQFICTTPKWVDACQCNLNSFYTKICQIPCPDTCHCFLNSKFNTQVIDCTRRNLTVIPSKSSSETVIIFYISNNALTSIGPLSLKMYSSSKELYFDHNQLTTIHPAAFEDVQEVVILSLKSNLLTQLPAGIFQHLTKLTELYLSYNRIKFMPSNTFKLQTHLSVLRLHNNSLTNFSVWEVQDPIVGNLHSSLHNNPWMCDCLYVNKFRVWLQNFSYRLDDASQLFCTMDDGTVSQIPLISFNSPHCYDLDPQFSIFQNVPLWSSFLAVLLLILVVSVLVFIYRAEVQVLVYSRYGFRVFHHQKEADGANKPYDAFIAFSSFDDEFVVNQILPGLEEIEKPYKVCIHQRDFMVGAIITESILEAVEKSQRTLVILSEHFVKSGWCRFEFKSAHMKMLTDRCSRVIIIILDTVPKDLDPEMQLYMKTNTYLKWGEKFFWEKLYFALPDKRHKPVVICDMQQ